MKKNLSNLNISSSCLCGLVLAGTFVFYSPTLLADVTNPGFENNFSSWTEVDPAAISSVSRSGGSSAKITGSGGEVSQVVNVARNTNYVFSAFVRGNGEAGVEINGNETSQRVSSGSNWERVELSINSGPNTRVTVFGTSTGGEARFDDFALVAGATNTGGGGGGGNVSCNRMDNLAINSARSGDDFDGNFRPALAIDNNLGVNSRWSSNGSGNSITLDLGRTSAIRRVATAWFRANVRQAIFNVQTSNTRSNWTTVLSQASAGGSQGLINFDVVDTNARYVRIVGLGNSASAWNSLIEVDVFGCGEADGSGPTTTPPPVNPPTNPPPTTNNGSIQLIQRLFALEGGNTDNGVSPYRGSSMVFDALRARHVTPNGNGWRHELKMDQSNRRSMSDTTERFTARIQANLSDGSKTIVAQYHGGGLGTLVKLYISDTSEGGHDDSRPNNGIFDVYLRMRPEGASRETIINLGTMRSGESFNFDLRNQRGRVTASGMGVTRTINVADSDQAYFKFGNYLQAQDPITEEDVDDQDDWANHYRRLGITTSVVTFTNVSYTTDL